MKPQNTPKSRRKGYRKDGAPPSTAWKPGQSGNPGGRPAVAKELREAFLAHSPEALAKLLELMRQDQNKKIAREAADSILDRAGLKGFCVEPENHAFVGEDGKPLEQFVVRLVRPGEQEQERQPAAEPENGEAK